MIALVGGASRIGRAADIVDGLVDTEIGVVCGSLGPLRKGLKSQEGANLEVKVLLEELVESR